MPFALGHFLSYVLRMINAVIAPDLVRDMGLDAAQLGFLTSAYFLAFAAFQLPLGLLLDRFGPRRTEAALLLFAGLGTLVFALAHSLEVLIVGRILIGFGLSAGLMAALKAFVLWFPRERWSFANGCILAAGGLGALTATAPVEAALGYTDWRGVLLVLAGLCVAASVLIFFVAPEPPIGGATSPARTEGWREQLKGIGRVYSNPVFWRYTIPTLAAVSTMFATQSLWAGPWMRDISGFDRSQVAGGLFILALAQIAGYLVIGFVAGSLFRRGVKTINTAITGMVLFVPIQLVLLFQLSPYTLPVWFAFGFVISTTSLSYAALNQNFPPELAGRVNTSANVLFFLGAFAAQAGMGGLIDLWPTTPTGGYAPEGYWAAFGTMLGLQILALAWFFMAPLIFPRARGN